jgi:hypothetical protein
MATKKSKGKHTTKPFNGPKHAVSRIRVQGSSKWGNDHHRAYGEMKLSSARKKASTKRLRGK